MILKDKFVSILKHMPRRLWIKYTSRYEIDMSGHLYAPADFESGVRAAGKPGGSQKRSGCDGEVKTRTLTFDHMY
jgi:hypothetical protein